jgi:hypothetical protein
MISDGSGMVLELRVRLNSLPPGTVSTVRAADSEPTPMNVLRTVAFSLFTVAVVGCGSSRPQADIDRGQNAVTAAPDDWKANEPPTDLKSLPDPVESGEELRAARKLVDYSVLEADGSDPEVIRVAVSVKLQDRKGKPSEREVVYSVALKSSVVVARDTYF